jgi:secreted PhoX family phosphatase
VEVNPLTGEAKKLTSLGRCAHECATCVRTKDGRVAVYTGDDKNSEFLYKMISDKKDSLEQGELFVANLEKGEWISLSIDKHKVLKDNFKDQTDVLIHVREAGKLLGATPLDRPEDIEIHPKTGDVFVTLTNNKPNGNYHGKILKISEASGDHGSIKFKASDFLLGGDTFSCPDNMVFDKDGNLWMATDISGSAMNKAPYVKFKNNGLFFIPTSGKNAGKVFQVASAPNDAELTGLTLTPDGKTLFVSVQHPGEKSKDMNNMTSHWPDGANSMPKSAVVQIKLF